MNSQKRQVQKKNELQNKTIGATQRKFSRQSFLIFKTFLYQNTVVVRLVCLSNRLRNTAFALPSAEPTATGPLNVCQDLP